MDNQKTVMVREEQKQELVNYNQEQIDVIKKMYAKDANDTELKLFLMQSKRTGLDILARQIHFVKRGGRAEIQTGIDGYRAIADRTGKYAGNDDYVFNEGLSEYGCISKNIKMPMTATATVYKMVNGIRCPFSATVRWEEYCPKAPNDFMWKKMPFLMLGKCAEALAFRKAFPNNLSGIYTEEEMQQSNHVPEQENPRPRKQVNPPVHNNPKTVPENTNTITEDQADRIWKTLWEEKQLTIGQFTELLNNVYGVDTTKKKYMLQIKKEFYPEIMDAVKDLQVYHDLMNTVG